jgi:hypothetical protein
MIGAAIIQVQLTVHFWDTFAAPKPQIKALVVGVAIWRCRLNCDATTCRNGRGA